MPSAQAVHLRCCRYQDDPVPDEWQCIGRVWFAVDLDVGIAVWFGELPDRTAELLTTKRNDADAEGWRHIAEGL